MNKFNKLYETLTNEERIKLFIQALARNDDEELDRLDNSCPQRTYRMTDYEFKSKKINALIISAFHMLDSYQSLTLAMASLISLLAFEGNEDKKSEQNYEISKDCFNTSMALFKGREEGWKMFCDSIGIDPKQTREAFKMVIPWDENGAFYFLESLSFDIKPNSKVTESTVSQLKAIWER